MTQPTHYTAWLTNVSSCLDQPNMDITVLEDYLIGDPADGTSAWASAGNDPIFYAVTRMPADYDGNPFPAVEKILDEAGWQTSGQWNSVDTGYIITVCRAFRVF